MNRKHLFLTHLLLFLLVCIQGWGQALELKEIYTVSYRTDISSLADSTKDDLFPRSTTTGAVHFYRGISYMEEKSYIEAIQDFKIARNDSTLSKTICNFYLGMAFMQLDLPDSIYSICSYALETSVSEFKKPEYWENLPFTKDRVFFSYLLGTNEVLHQSIDTALIDALFGFSTKESKFYEAHYNYGNYCFTIGRFKKAVDLFLKARDLNKSEDSILLLGMGYFYRLSGDLAQSEKAYDMLLISRPNDARAYNNRGCLFGFMEKFDKSISDLNKALKKNNRLLPAYCNRGIVYLKMQRFERAIRDFTTAIQFQPDFGDAYYYRGFARKAKGDIPGSVVDFTQAIALKKSMEVQQP